MLFSMRARARVCVSPFCFHNHISSSYSLRDSRPLHSPYNLRNRRSANSSDHQPAVTKKTGRYEGMSCSLKTRVCFFFFSSFNSFGHEQKLLFFFSLLLLCFCKKRSHTSVLTDARYWIDVDLKKRRKNVIDNLLFHLSLSLFEGYTRTTTQHLASWDREECETKKKKKLN